MSLSYPSLIGLSTLPFSVLMFNIGVEVQLLSISDLISRLSLPCLRTSCTEGGLKSAA
jgi:hypothetical protein